MSLLNQVLRELAQKKAKPTPLPLIPVALKPSFIFKPVSATYGLFLVLLSGLFVFGSLLSVSNSEDILAKAAPSKHIMSLPEKVFASPVLSSYIIPVPDLEASFSDEPMIEEENDEENFDSPMVENTTGHVKKVFAKLSLEELHDAQMNKALKAIKRGDDEAGIELLENLLVEYPASDEARETLATLYINFGRIDKAERVINEGLEINPEAIQLIGMKARILVEQSQFLRAITLMEQYSPDINQEPDFYGLFAAALESAGRSNEAGSIYEALIKVEPENPQYWLGYGIALEKKKSLKQAIEAYKRVAQHYDVGPETRSFAQSRLKILQG